MQNKLFVFFLLLSPVVCLGQAGNYEKAWKAISQNKWKEAEVYLNEALKEPQSAKDAYISKIYIDIYKGREDRITDFEKVIYTDSDNPYPYIYSLWFNDCVAGNPGKKQLDHQLKLLERLFADKTPPGRL